MIELYWPPLYFAWRLEQGLPYVVHFYVAKRWRSFKTSSRCAEQVRQYFARLGFKYFLMNARCEEPRVQKALEHHFKVRPYDEVDEHKFYLVEV